MRIDTEIDPYLVLGRQRIDISPDFGYLAGKRVLVTGAGGSIGSALCRRLALYHVRDLVMLDRDESALHALKLSLSGRALFDDDTVMLGDIRDWEWMEDIFRFVRPDVVFHVAALKHQALLENYPTEAVKTNIYGTANVLRACSIAGVDLLVNVSTDKAADPACVLGASKRIAERLVASYTAERFISVRFGNVFGSRGSVVDAFIWQIINNSRITITSPLMSRYFITPAESIDLLIHAGAIGKPGEVLVMDMGDSVSIGTIAQRLIEQLGVSAEIVYTGIRPGEKVNEVLLGLREVDHRPSHPLISQVQVDPFADPNGVIDSLSIGSGNPKLVKSQMFDVLGGA